MKTNIRRVLSLVLAMAFALVSFSCITALAVTESELSEKMFKITPENDGDAISFRQQNLVAGHTYRLEMLQKGITSVQAFSTSPDWDVNKSSNVAATVM